MVFEGGWDTRSGVELGDGEATTVQVTHQCFVVSTFPVFQCSRGVGDHAIERVPVGAARLPRFPLHLEQGHGLLDGLGQEVLEAPDRVFDPFQCLSELNWFIFSFVMEWHHLTSGDVVTPSLGQTDIG